VDDVRALGEANVVDEDVEAAERLHRPQDHVGDALVGRDVGLNRQHPVGTAGYRPQPLDRLGDPGLAAGADGDLTPLLHQGGGDGQTQTSGRTGDDGDLGVEAELHRRPISVRRVRSGR